MTPTHIVVVQTGWVFIGRMTLGESIVILTHASCIRKWGTTKGLGQLALSGPQKETILDPCGTVEIHRPSMLFALPVASKAWHA